MVSLRGQDAKLMHARQLEQTLQTLQTHQRQYSNRRTTMRARLMNRISTLAIAALAFAGVTAADPANATTVTFNLSGGSSALTGSNGNTRSFTGSDSTTTVIASGWGRTGNSSTTFQTGYLGYYSSGLGVTDRLEDGTNSSHTMDNVGALDFIAFYFSKDVKLTDVTLTAFTASGVTGDPDSDISVWFGEATSNANLASAIDGQTLTQINTTLPGRVDVDGPSTSATHSQAVAGLDYGNVLIVGANIGSLDRDDLIKIGLLTVDIDTTVHTNPHDGQVPEPASGLLLLGGLGSAWFARRRRNRAARA
jgi:hypothetical protein